MKSHYRYYGRDSAGLIKNLSESDKEILNAYLTYCATTAGATKVNDYRRYMLQFCDVIEQPLDRITKEDAVAVWALINHSPHEDNTKIMMRRTIRRFLKWYYKDLDMIEPLRVGTKPQVNRKKVNKSVLFTHEEIKQMIHKAESLRDKALISLLAETGARPQEIRDLTWADINWEQQEVHLYCTKTKHDRDLPIHRSVTLLAMWHDQWAYSDPQRSDYIFPALRRANQSRNRSLSTEYINQIIKRSAKAINIQRRVNSYLLRHSRLTEIYNKGVKGIEHNLYAGHVPGSKQQTIYVHMDNQDMKRCVLEKVYQVVQKDNSGNAQSPDVSHYQREIKQLKRQITEMANHMNSKGA